MSRLPSFARRMRPLVTLVALGLSATVAIQAVAQNKPSRADQLTKYRQSIFTVIGTNFGALVPVIQGKAPYDAKDFAMRADRVAYMAQMAHEGFVPDSKDGKPSKAKAEIWTQQAEFDKLLKDLVERSRALATASQAGNLDQIKPAFGAVGQACKACHDKYKAD